MGSEMAQCFPVSIKGVISKGGKILLLKNERNEWELPGGKMEKDERIETCLVREIKEELSLSSEILWPLNNWVYFVNGIYIVIITYGLKCTNEEEVPLISGEHKELFLFDADEIADLNMPDGYKKSIEIFLSKTSLL